MGLRLVDGDRVCIVGGGPGGSFAALHLLHQAHQQGLRLEVLIFEPRNFTKPGPGGCNRCAGILSSRLLRGLNDLGLSIPDEIIQAELQAYALHLDGEVLRIERPDPQRRIVSVYRGSGPRLLHGDPEASFDDYLLKKACARGAKHIPSRVRSVEWEGKPVVQTAREGFPAELLVLATGVNSRAPLVPSFGYQPPKTEIMAQDEILRPATWPADQVSAFFREPPGMTFGAMIPKGRYLNISLLGQGFTRDTVSDFIELQGLDKALESSPNSLCGCTPRIAVGPARNFFGSRWVSVGDAAVTRLYKDGIGSAFFTTKSAMQTVLQQGISRRAFQKVYAPVCKGVQVDNRYGRLLFRLWSFTLRNPNLLRSWRNTIRMEAAQPADKRIHTRILWGMFTGDEPYRDLFWASLSPAAMSGLVRGLRNSRGKGI
ncbi:MAG: NAD(P)/FAD-dependent oxidoreductase [Anaerolineales bacterium]|nr:NAD(P)/FAD-dependent oxidoreductase [Anaerolineales bacterium]